jgi:serine/threonine-protein kinase
MVGTLRYAAPERLAGGDVTPRSDVWALGAVLYEMLTGVPAVTASDPVGALAASQAAPATLEGVPPYLASVIGRAMATDPADRYPDAVALRDALAADGVPVDPNAMTAVVPIVGMATAAGTAGAARLADEPAPAAEPLPGQTSLVPPLGPVEAPSRRRGSMRPGILTAGLVLAAVVLFALAGTSLLAGGTDGGTGSGAVASPQPTATRPAPTAKPTAQPTPKPKPGKGKGKDKQDGQD